MKYKIIISLYTLFAVSIMAPSILSAEEGKRVPFQDDPKYFPRENVEPPYSYLPLTLELPHAGIIASCKNPGNGQELKAIVGMTWGVESVEEKEIEYLFTFKPTEKTDKSVTIETAFIYRKTTEETLTVLKEKYIFQPEEKHTFMFDLGEGEYRAFSLTPHFDSFCK